MGVSERGSGDQESDEDIEDLGDRERQKDQGQEKGEKRQEWGHL